MKIRDQSILGQIVDTAKQGFGGNLDVVIRSRQVQELIELHAITTGRRMSGLATKMRLLSLVQTGSSLYQAPAYSNRVVLPSLGGLPLKPVAARNADPQPIVVKLDGQATTALLRGEAVQAIVENPRVVQGAAISATQSSAGRREMTGLQMSPGLLTG